VACFVFDSGEDFEVARLSHASTHQLGFVPIPRVEERAPFLRSRRLASNTMRTLSGGQLRDRCDGS